LLENKSSVDRQHGSLSEHPGLAHLFISGVIWID
jgi:hypothetical protein